MGRSGQAQMKTEHARSVNREARTNACAVSNRGVGRGGVRGSWCSVPALKARRGGGGGGGGGKSRQKVNAGAAGSGRAHMAGVSEESRSRVVIAVPEADAIEELDGERRGDRHAEGEALLHCVGLDGGSERVVDGKLDANTDEEDGDGIRLPEGEVAIGEERPRAYGALGEVLGRNRFLCTARGSIATRVGCQEGSRLSGGEQAVRRSAWRV